jgi:hypothetical protein
MHKFILALLASVAVITAQEHIYKAPTPADWAAMAKLPDFSGVWERGGVGGGGNAAFGTAPAGNRGGAAAGQRAGGGGQRGAGAAAAGGGQRAAAAARGPQLTPQYEAMRAAAARPQVEDNSTANCLPPGMPGIMNQPYPMEFLLTPGKVTIVIEAYTEVRHIYTDGRPLPEDPDPKFFGTSVGHWEGDTLVVETVGLKIVERFRLTDPDTMSYETTITDPAVLTAPYTTTSTLRRHRNWTISEYICEENNRNYVDQAGKAGINLAVPGTPKKD